MMQDTDPVTPAPAAAQAAPTRGHIDLEAKAAPLPDAGMLLAYSGYARQWHGDSAAAFEAMATSGAPTRTGMQAWLESRNIGDEDALREALLDLRRQVWLTVFLLECSGRIGLREATRAFTDFAEIALAQALRVVEAALAEQHGRPRGQHSGEAVMLSVIALGRLGGGELGPACDADLVFVFGEDGRSDGPRALDNHAYYAALLTRLFRVLGKDEQGRFVLRLFNRWQPHGGGGTDGPSACSLTAFERYFSDQLDEGSRSVWIHGRVLAGPDTALTQVVHPFVFRRFLDYGVFATLRTQHAALRREIAQAALEDNIRLGPGGLREIEFLLHSFQLVRGGRDSRLRIHSIQALLDAMAYRRELPANEVQGLSAAYAFLRALEHRLQYRQDSLVHEMDDDPGFRDSVAHTLGLRDTAHLEEQLARHRQQIRRTFDAVFRSDSGSEEDDPLAALWQGETTDGQAYPPLVAAGHEDPERSLAILIGLRESMAFRAMGRSGRQQLDSLMPALLRFCGQHGEAAETLRRCIAVIEPLCPRPAYLSLLAQHSGVLERLVKFCSASPWVAHFLAQHPILLDELLYPGHLVEAADADALAVALAKLLDREAGGALERQMELCCEFRQLHTFRLVARELLLGLTPRELGQRLSLIADCLLAEIARRVWAGMATRHLDAPRFAMIAYGKHGSRELSYAGDLDLVFLFEDDHPDAQEIYVRFAKRLLAWLNCVTPVGALFETDLRLRPDGDSGILVSSIASFDDYQRRRAWTWEHQALTRARFTVGDPAVGAAFEALREQILCAPRESDTLRGEITAMRQRMADGHPNRSNQFDLKHDIGGLVDVEFSVQYLVLAHAAQHPQLAGHRDNAAQLDLAGNLGLVDEAVALAAAEAYENLRHLQHNLRLRGKETAKTDFAFVQREIAAVRGLWKAVFGQDR
ncbi:MAG: bifunctional [glutamate--ammonia ligase]-adenylyl-L-tyrosine phosphorylase/[glutamate--ammonia-ligase] adenylyltransferase [Rhodocyclaceae bacterium]|nr:MAG: bifunctional [glutamate--ammonia ligase]-adenylyl-L-tyrosine phosphorylase/[glutamate--ammonia-ligase] adenylyltransferase [Rhodocyclaceae bacterium]